MLLHLMNSKGINMQRRNNWLSQLFIKLINQSRNNIKKITSNQRIPYFCRKMTLHIPSHSNRIQGRGHRSSTWKHWSRPGNAGPFSFPPCNSHEDRISFLDPVPRPHRHRIFVTMFRALKPCCSMLLWCSQVHADNWIECAYCSPWLTCCRGLKSEITPIWENRPARQFSMFSSPSPLLLLLA